MTTTAARHDVIERQVVAGVLLAAILAAEAVTQEHVEPGERDVARHRHVLLQRQHRRNTHRGRRTTDNGVVLLDDEVCCLDYRLDCAIPGDHRQREVRERLEVSVQNKCRVGTHGNLLSLFGGHGWSRNNDLTVMSGWLYR